MILTSDLSSFLDDVRPGENPSVVCFFSDKVQPGEPTKYMADICVTVAKTVTVEEPYEVNVFEYLNSFAVVASPKFLRALLAHPSIERAIPNCKVNLNDHAQMG